MTIVDRVGNQRSYTGPPLGNGRSGPLPGTPTLAPLGKFAAVTPTRLLDTRDGTGGTTKPVGQASSITLQIAGTAGVPATGVTAVVLNVTATNPTSDSYVSVYPNGQARTSASNLNFTPGQTIPNLVVVPVTNGKIDFYNNSGTVDLIADITGYYTTGNGASYSPTTPTRLLDTRDGTGGTTKPVGQASSITLQIAGTAGIPATGVTAVVLNVTATNPTSDSYVSVYPNGQTRTSASNLNFTPGQTIPNLVVVPVTNGKIDFYNNSGTVDLIADITGYYTTGNGASYSPTTPTRLLDTRDGTGGTTKPVGQASSITLQIAGTAGIPATGVTAVVLNVTATNPTSDSYVSVYPNGQTRTSASNLNFTPGQTIPNLVVVPVTNGKIDFYNNSGTVDLIADITGYYTA
ncbi:hypothetical protein ACIGZJ_21905 [Kitasatospora sp. NPDC052868]|uniref:hypothetical protein n=1 Tax=Kitasatospora sp. NPDC052868 TaxID=3364060 RepID=UPI0037CABD7E